MREYIVASTSKFDKDVELAKKRGLDPEELETVIDKLRFDIPLERKYKDHMLRGGKYKGFRECHINPDWLLVYRKDRGKLILLLARTATHSDLF